MLASPHRNSCFDASPVRSYKRLVDAIACYNINVDGVIKQLNSRVIDDRCFSCFTGEY